MTSVEYSKKMAEISMDCMERLLAVTRHHLGLMEQVEPPQKDKDRHELQTASLREKIASMDHAYKLSKMMKKEADGTV